MSLRDLSRRWLLHWSLAVVFGAVMALAVLIWCVCKCRRDMALVALNSQGFEVQRYWATAFGVFPEEHIILHGRGALITDVQVPNIARNVKALGNVECVYVRAAPLTREGAWRLWSALNRDCQVEVETDGVWYALEPSAAGSR